MSKFNPELLDDPECSEELSPGLSIACLKDGSVVMLASLDEKLLVLGLGSDADKLVEMANTFIHMAGHLDPNVKAMEDDIDRELELEDMTMPSTAIH